MGRFEDADADAGSIWYNVGGQAISWGWVMAKYRKLAKGDKIGDLEFIRRVPGRRSEWLCSCGRVFECLTHNVTSMHTKSCGCEKSRLVSEAMSRRHADQRKTEEAN